MARGSKFTMVLNFFREASMDEVRAIGAEEAAPFKRA
jgi:hypothetical protein